MKIAVIKFGNKSQFFDAAKKLGHEVIIIDPNYTYLYISDRETGYDEIHLVNPDNGEMKKIKRDDIDLIIPRLSDTETGSDLVQFFTEVWGKPSTQSAAGIRTASDKFKTHMRLSAVKGITQPKTIYAAIPVNPEFLIKKVGGISENKPLIIKQVTGSQGYGVFPIRNIQDANEILNVFYRNKIKVIIQQFIESGATDIRTIVAGCLTENPITIASMKRIAPKGSLKANLSQGGTGEIIELNDYEKGISYAAAAAVGLDVAGVDLIRDNNGKVYCIEVNSNFGLKISSITGIDVPGKIIEYAVNNKNKRFLDIESEISERLVRLSDYNFKNHQFKSLSI
ncbi:MAG TPA: RimK family alpha-L-glutamate ligase [Bacteroidia bacterium]|nr:RimK family alpha-L-glutamate ligase [Bacteroidia bacterium]HRS57990.1 RimK family alpha-L-glutamate ligase [Bacteroidia bacterium]HRU68555.1 RimK family alpha-L-glutamate ligase [Bacteroidia bacterium]